MGNKKKAYFLIIIIAVVVMVLSSQIDLWAQVLKDEQNGYSFEYPFGWQAKVFKNSRNLVKGEIVKDKDTGLQIRIYETKNNLQDFVEWYTADFIRQMEGHWGGDMVVFDQQFTNIAGRECFVVIFDFVRKDNKRWFLKQHMWLIEGGILVLQSGTPFELRLLSEPDIYKIARSLKLF